MFRLMFLIICLLFNMDIYADPLLLTSAEMQKLKHYFPEEENTHLVWKGDALQVILTLNQEKRIIFPDRILPDLKGALTTDMLDMVNDNQSLYLTAKKPFASVRLFVSVENTNQVVLIDLSAKEVRKDSQENNTPIYIDLPKNEILQSKENAPVFENDTAVTLVRYAWQQLFAPVKYLDNSLNISRAPMHTTYFVSSLVNGDKVIAHPMASWTYQNTYVTAIELRNKYPHPTTIHIPEDLCGHWKAAVLYKAWEDRSFLFVVSTQPFGDSMGYCHGGA